MGSIITHYHTDKWWIKAKSETQVRVCIGEIDDRGTKGIFQTMSWEAFEKETGRNVIDEPVYKDEPGQPIMCGQCSHIYCRYRRAGVQICRWFKKII